MSQMQISIAKMVIGSILSPNAMLILILYVPMVVVLLRLQNQVIVLQNRIDFGCTATMHHLFLNITPVKMIFK